MSENENENEIPESITETFIVRLGVVGMAGEAMQTYDVTFDMADPTGSLMRAQAHGNEAVKKVTQEFLPMLQAYLEQKYGI